MEVKPLKNLFLLAADRKGLKKTFEDNRAGKILIPQGLKPLDTKELRS